MVESSVLGTSPWNSDPFLCKDLNPFPGLDCQSLLDVGLNEPEIGNSESLPFLSDPLITLEEDSLGQDFYWSGHDYLTTSSASPVSTTVLIQDSNCATEDSLGFESLSWTVEESSWQSDSSSESPPTPSLPASNQSPRKKSRAHNPLSPSKSWSRMSGEEQLGTVEALTQIISHQMGLREQLEVIQIIDPKAVISTTDTEFVIDLGCLNDVKLQRIREYVTKHAQELGSHQDVVSSRLSGGQSNRSGSSCSSSATSSFQSETGSSSSSNSSTSGKPSKKQLREQHKQWKAWRQRQRKEQRQTLKERRSGLFVKNEILWLNAAEDTSDVNDHDLEEDIDILA